MAKAKINYEERTVQRLFTDVEKVPTGVTLELTFEEAQTLHTILRRVGGCPESSLRGYADGPYHALKSCGVGYYDFDVGVGSIHFRDTTLYAAVKNETGINEDPGPSVRYVEIIEDGGGRCLYYHKGDIGRVLEEGENAYYVDFNNNGNFRVFGNGKWYVPKSATITL